MRPLVVAILSFACISPLTAQVVSPSTSPFVVPYAASTLPSSCNKGDLFVIQNVLDPGSGSDAILYICTRANTWNPLITGTQGSGSSNGKVPLFTDGYALNLSSGTQVVTSLGGVGSIVATSVNALIDNSLLPPVLTMAFFNDMVTGTQDQLLAKITVEGGGAVYAITADPSTDQMVPVYPVLQGGGTSGITYLASGGWAFCYFSTAANFNDYIILGSGGGCASAGKTYPQNAWVIGTAMQRANIGDTIGVAIINIPPAPSNFIGNATDPATCSPGNVEFNTTSGIPKICLTTNSWSSFLTSTPGYTGDILMNGVTSGGQGFTVPDIAGTATLYVLPTAPSSGSFLKDNGSTTCPTLAPGSPTNCEALAWASPTVSSLPFNDITAATNTNALLMGSGGSLGPTGTGYILANRYSGTYLAYGIQTTGMEVGAGDCGIVMDGTDQATALQNCVKDVSAGGIFSIPAAGLVIKFPPGNLGMSHGITITNDNISLVGAGGYGSSNLGTCTTSGNCPGRTRFVAITGTWGDNHPMLTWDGTGQSKKFLVNPGLSGIELDANSLASEEVKLNNVSGGIFRDFRFHNHTSTLTVGGEYGITITSGNTSTSGSSCGSNSGVTIFEDGAVQSFLAGAGGIGLGIGSNTTPDVCSFKLSNVVIETNLPVGMHSLYFYNSDSNQVTNAALYGFVGSGVTSIVATSATTATVTTATNHKMPSGTTNDGVFIFKPCTTPLVSHVCTGSTVPGLKGAFSAAYASANTINISGAYGLTNTTTYYADDIGGTGLELGGVSGGSTEDHNMLTHVFANWGVHNTGNQWNLVTGLNLDNEDQDYLRPAGVGFPITGVNGDLWNYTFRNQVNITPTGPWPNSVVNFTGTVPAFNAVIDMSNLGTNGFNALLLPGGAAVTGPAGQLIQVDTSNNVNVNSVFGSPGSTYINAPSGQSVVIQSGGSISATFDSSHNTSLVGSLTLPYGSGSLKMKNATSGTINVMSVSGSSGSEQTNYGSGNGGFAWFTGSGNIITLSNNGDLGIQHHFVSTGTAPTISGCGSGGSVGSDATDEGGTITLGTIPGSCVVTFATAYGAAPKCVVSFRAGTLGAYTVSASALTVTATGLTGSFDYRCAQ